VCSVQWISMVGTGNFRSHVATKTRSLAKVSSFNLLLQKCRPPASSRVLRTGLKMRLNSKGDNGSPCLTHLLTSNGGSSCSTTVSSVCMLHMDVFPAIVTPTIYPLLLSGLPTSQSCYTSHALYSPVPFYWQCFGRT
jgi:hypothetical protein